MPKNRVRLRGGAGGGPTVGGAIGLWWPSAFIVLPLAALVFFGIGYASVTTLSIAIIVTIIFAVRYSMGLATLPDVFYGVIAFVLLGVGAASQYQGPDRGPGALPRLASVAEEGSGRQLRRREPSRVAETCREARRETPTAEKGQARRRPSARGAEVRLDRGS